MTSILMLSECYHPIRNGVVTSLDTFSTSLKSRGHKVTILASNHRDKNLYFDDQNMVYRLPALTLPLKTNYPLPIPLIDNKLSNVIFDNDFDLVHSQSIMTMGRLGVRVSKQLKIPLVLTYHTLIEEYHQYFPIFPPKLVVSVARDISYRYCMKANHIIVPGPHVYDKLKKYGITTDMTVIPTGINLREIDAASPEDLALHGIPKGAKIIVYVGRVAPEKNIFKLFETYNLLAKKMDNVHLLIVGGGPLYDNCVNDRESSPYKDRIHFTNYLPKQQVLKIFKAADIMLFTSNSETQGLVFAESMAANTPIVATDSNAANAIIENGVNGILCDNNEEDLAAKCYELLNNDSLYKTIQENAQKRAKDYDDELMTDRLLEVYEKTLLSYGSKLV